MMNKKLSWSWVLGPPVTIATRKTLNASVSLCTLSFNCYEINLRLSRLDTSFQRIELRWRSVLAWPKKFSLSLFLFYVNMGQIKHDTLNKSSWHQVLCCKFSINDIRFRQINYRTKFLTELESPLKRKFGSKEESRFEPWDRQSGEVGVRSSHHYRSQHTWR